MTYCKQINFLLIHIPKTGGTSVYFYLRRKYSRNNVTLFSGLRNQIIPNPEFRKVSLQHQLYTTLFAYQKVLGIDFNENIKVAAIVRNPYTRIISDLLSLDLITTTTDPEEVYETIQNKYLYNDNLDNHNIPQYKFVCDENGNLVYSEPKHLLMI